jgi:histidinol-phosphate aminotransferase
MYRIISQWSMSEPIEVPLDDQYRFDLEAMRSAMREDTTLMYVCNPNNPTGTVVSGDAVTALVDLVPDKVLVVIDEAYHDFVADPAYRTGIPLALERRNVVVLRTFSKVFALASHRLGYAIGRPETLTELRKAQAPFSVTTVAQAVATASLGQPDELKRRIESNAAGRHHLLGVIAERGLPHAHSETNFVFVKLGEDSSATASWFEQRGVIIRPMAGGWQRVTVGTEAENQRFVSVLDHLLPDI